MKNELSHQEKRFCYEYIVDYNQTAAYIRAGYSTNYSTASVNSHKKINEPKIKDFIEFLTAERNARTSVTGDKVIEELAKIAFFNPRNIKQTTYNKETGEMSSRLKDLSEMSPEDSAVISEITERQIHRDNDAGITVIDRKYKFHSKSHALEQLGKHTGIYEKDNSQKQVAQVVISLPSNGKESTKNVTS